MAETKGLNQIFRKEKLNELYIKKELPMAEIARQHNVAYQSIIYWLKKFGMKIRGPKTYDKKSFFGDTLEKYYMIGLSLGDFNVKKHQSQIMVKTSTTHPSMINIFKQVFEEYSFVNQIKIKGGFSQYFWYIYTILDNSFEFLLQNELDIANLEEEEFYAFLSGYTDAEGCLCITTNKEHFRYHFALASQDIDILNGVKDYLFKLGYKFSFRLSTEKGSYKSGKIYNKDYWSLNLYSKNQVLSLISKLTLKHYEKVRWRNLMFKLRNYKKWSEIQFEVLKLREDIKNEISKCIKSR
jgi:hypothetical protein